MSRSVSHQRTHTKMVKQVLKDVARQNQFSYQVVFQDFIDENPTCTQCFWETFYRLFPDSHYHYVAFCHTCRHFDLYDTEIAMLNDDPHG
jgi:hypothetical protein